MAQDPASRRLQSDAPRSAAKTAEATRDRPLPDGESYREVVGETVTIDRPRDELYRFWRDFTNLPQFMAHLETVRVIDERRSHWSVTAPGGDRVEWDAEIIEDVPGETIAWRSLEGADVRNSGRITFRDGAPGRGTEVSATIAYDPPGGTIGKLVAKLLQEEPKIQARRDLRRLKQLMETGEIPTARMRRE